MRGEDYEVREVSPGSWQIAQLDGETPDAPVAPPAKKKAAVKGNGKDPVEVPAGTTVTKLPAKAARGAKMPPPPPAPPPPPEPEKIIPPGTDLSPLPVVDGVLYSILIDPRVIRQESVVAIAYEIARRFEMPVMIQNQKGEIARSIDPAAIKELRQQGRSSPRAPRAAGEGGSAPRATGKSAEAAALLFREQGATKAEIVAVTEWTFGERYIRRIAGVHKARMEVLGKDHWRLHRE